MVSPELLRRYPFFGGLSMEQITTLAKVADEVTAEPGHYFFHEQEILDHFYLILEGQAAITIHLPTQGKQIVTSTLRPDDIFAWSALVPPHNATSNVQALTPCRVVRFDCRDLRRILEQDTLFGYLMMQKTAQIIRERLRDMRIETLADKVERAPL